MTPIQSKDIYRQLSRRPRRGRVVFGTLSLAFAALGGAALATGGSGALAALIVGLLFGLGYLHVRERDDSARRIAEGPHSVFWVHASTIPLQNPWLFSLTTLSFVVLHLRDGRQFEVALPPDEMEHFIQWLRQQNPSVRLGAYDGASQA